jgi:hypothetical protein
VNEQYSYYFDDWGFHWTDTGDAGVGGVTQVDMVLQLGVDCSIYYGYPAPKAVSLNGYAIGTFNPADNCYCSTLVQSPRSFSMVNPVFYTKGATNTVVVSGGYFEGLTETLSAPYAAVTVTYAALPAYALQTGCRQALKSKLKYSDDTDDKDKLQWKWGKGALTTQADFANPTSTASYQLCVFGKTAGAPSLLLGADVYPHATRWASVGSTGFKYKDTDGTEDGITKVQLKGGAAGKSKIGVKGKGVALDDVPLPLAPAITGIRVQLINESNGVCWESDFPMSGITADSESIKASAP